MSEVNPFNGNGTGEGGGGGGGTPADYNQVKAQVAQNKSDIATIKTEQTQQNNSISGLQSSTESISGSLNTLQQSQTAQDNAISGLQSSVTGLNNSVSGLQTQTESLSGSLNTLQSQVVTISGSVSSLQQSQSVQDTAIAKNAANIDTVADAIGIDLGTEYLPLQSNQAVKLNEVKSIDTGLLLDGNAEITAKGCVIGAGKQAILAGSYTSNSERTTLKLLSGSAKIQSQWANNAEITDLGGLDLLQPFEYTQNKTSTQITQGNITLTCNNGGFSGASGTTKIYLFNQTESGEFNNGFLFYATITHSGVVYEFKPMRKLKDGVELGIVILKNGKELDLNGGVLELVTF